MKLNSRNIAAILRREGFKLTPQRRAVLQVISQSRDHLSPAALIERVRQEHPGIGRVTVYRTIELLSSLNLICTVHADDNQRSYLMRRPSGHTTHLICSGCGKVVDFTTCELASSRASLPADGFAIEGHLLEFHGRCQECQHAL
jgi:Fur family ferric uptake transcriptional regulator